jgi:hypothetical protein
MVIHTSGLCCGRRRSMCIQRASIPPITKGRHINKLSREDVCRCLPCSTWLIAHCPRTVEHRRGVHHHSALALIEPLSSPPSHGTGTYAMREFQNQASNHHSLDTEPGDHLPRQQTYRLAHSTSSSFNQHPSWSPGGGLVARTVVDLCWKSILENVL